ncbi:MAG: hypothetical protein ACP5NX_00825 [Candidatus Bilamarchaeaceae archaeon]
MVTKEVAMGYAEENVPFPTAKDQMEAFKMVGKGIWSLVPLTWLPDSIENMKRAENPEQLGVQIGFACVLLGLDITTLIPGAGTVAAKGAKVAVKGAAKTAVKAAKGTFVEELSFLVRSRLEQAIELGDTKAAQAAQELLDFITKNTGKVSRSMNTMMETVKALFSYKSESGLFKALNGELEDAGGMVSKAMFGSEAAGGALKTGVDVTVMSFDKGGTWFLNNISREFGDLGFFVYMKALFETSSELGVNAVMRTGSDEIILVALKQDGKDIAKVFQDRFFAKISAMISDLEKSASPGALKTLQELKSTLGKVAVESEDAVLRQTDDGLRFFSQHQFDPKTPITLSQLLSNAETRVLFSKLEGGTLKIAQRFARLRGSTLKGLPEGMKAKDLSGVASFRLSFGEPFQKAFEEVAQESGKAVGQVYSGTVGPSFLNLMGHSGVDYFTSKYAEAMVSAFRKAGVEIEVFQAGPMSVGYKIIKGKAKDVSAVMKDADSMFMSSIDESVRPSSVRTFYGSEKAVDGAIFDASTYGLMRGANREGVGRGIALLHTPAAKDAVSGITEAMVKDGISESMAKKAGYALKQIEGADGLAWVRQPEDLINFLRMHGFDDAAITSALKGMGSLFR